MKNHAKDLSRRKMIRAAAVVPFAAVRGSASNSAVTVGLIGSGKRGPTVARLMVEHTRGRLVALCDLYEEKIERAKKMIGVDDVKAYQDYEKLLTSDVDAVIIATPAFLHAEPFEAAVKAGKHIYIEKPAAPDVAGCKRIMRAADGADRKLNIAFGFQRRYGAVYRKAKELLDSGAIGSIRLAQAQFVKSAGARPRPAGMTPPSTLKEQIRQWYSWRHLSGDLIVENNIHLIDVMNWFLGGHPTKAHGTGGQTLERLGDVRDHNQVTFDYADRVQGCLLGTTLAPPFYRKVYEQFFGSEGAIETASEYWKHYRNRDDTVVEESLRSVSIDAIDEFIRRVEQGHPENTAIRGAESTLTAILGRMAMDRKREVTWEEMMRSA